jgi:predicted amidohydrolase YtcJ
MIRIYTFCLLFLVLFSGCHMKENADLILVNGLVYTVDSSFSIKQAFAVGNGVFLATGTNDEILSSFQSGLIIDAGGKPVFPGLIDGHCHFYGYAMGLNRWVNLKGTRSFDEILQVMKQDHETHPNTWILGKGWDQNDWESKAFPDKSMLDRIFPDNPVVLNRVDGHALLANSEALRRAGITAQTRVDAGEVELKNGQMTGILLDNAADMMKNAVPEKDLRQKEKDLVEAQQECFRLGLTSVVDAGLEFRSVMLIDSLQQSGQLKMRINAMLSPSHQNITEFIENGPFQKERLTVNSIKLYADGALGSRGALLLQPYSDDPGNDGIRMASPDSLYNILVKAYDRNFQVNTHCIGDSANRMMLNLYGEVLKGPNDRRWRIEHAQVVNPDDFQLFAKFNIIPSIQSMHCTSDMYWAESRLGPVRVKSAYAYKKLLQQNGWLVNGTDFPIEEINPLLTFFAAVARTSVDGYPEGGFQMENALSREEAIRSMTIWAAKGSFEDDIKGSIEPGKLADFIILEKDIMTVGLAKIPGIKVLKTYLDGELVFEAK